MCTGPPADHSYGPQGRDCEHRSQHTPGQLQAWQPPEPEKRWNRGPHSREQAKQGGKWKGPAERGVTGRLAWGWQADEPDTRRRLCSLGTPCWRNAELCVSPCPPHSLPTTSPDPAHKP